MTNSKDGGVWGLAAVDKLCNQPYEHKVVNKNARSRLHKLCSMQFQIQASNFIESSLVPFQEVHDIVCPYQSATRMRCPKLEYLISDSTSLIDRRGS
jgi:hypothetical protein